MNIIKWLYPGIGFKRWMFLFSVGLLLICLGIALLFNYKYLDTIEEWIFYTVYYYTGSYNYEGTVIISILSIIIGIFTMLFAIRKSVKSIISALIPNNQESLASILYNQRLLNKGPSITVIGGGTGLSVLLRGIKKYTSNITAVVTVADDGGSSGRLREEFSMIPPGDLRNCLVALADTEPLMEKLFQYRFSGNSDLTGHSFGNLFITAMGEVTGDMELALKESSKILAVRGEVYPSTTENIKLSAIMTDGSVIWGESNIPESKKSIKRVEIHPRHAEAVKSSLDAIKKADIIILGPGSLYTSIIPNLLVEDIALEIAKSKAIKIYICNVMTQIGETDNYTASMHLKAIIDHAGDNIVDYIIINNSIIDNKTLQKYREKNQFLVNIDVEEVEKLGVNIEEADIIDIKEMIHHDSNKLASTIMKIYQDNKI